MKKILCITANNPAPVVRRKCEVLHKNNYRVYLLYWNRLNSMVKPPFTINIPNNHLIPVNLSDPRGHIIKRLYFNWLFFLNILKTMQSVRPSVLHAVNLDMFLICWFIIFLYPNTKLVLDLLDTRELYLKKPLISLLRISLRKADLIFVTSPYFRGYFLNRIKPNLNNELVNFVPNAPSSAHFKNFKKRKELDLRIGYFGFLRGDKSISTLVESVTNLRNKGFKISVLFAGVGISLPLVKRMADQYDFITYIGSFTYEIDIKKLYQIVDLVYSVYFNDFNYKIHLSCRLSESIISKIPIIVQNGSYQADYIKQYNIGYTVDYADKKQLVSLLSFLYNNQDDITQKSNNCKSIRNEHLFESYEKVIIDNYKILVKN